MNVDWHLVARIVIPLVAVAFGFFLNQWFEKKPRMISYLGHSSVFQLNDAQKTQVFSHSIVIYNSGTKPATNIKIGHAFFPGAINIFPSVEYKIVELPDGTKEIQIPQLVPNEQVTISYLYFPPTTWDKINTYSKFDEGFAEIIEVLPAAQLPQWKNNFFGGLFSVGLITTLYLLIKTFIWAWSIF